MQDLFNKRYRVAPTRLPSWDYCAGWYFITVCTHQRTPWLSTVVGLHVELSPIGLIIVEEWLRTPLLRPHVTLDTWVVMPDHFHAIIGIHGNAPNAGMDVMDRIDVETPRRGVSTLPSSPSSGFPARIAGNAPNAGMDSDDPDDPIDPIDVETPRRGVSTMPSSPPSGFPARNDATMGTSPPSPIAVPRLRAGSLGALVGQWKSAATKRIRADLCADFAWQARFYDVIIRDAAMLARLRDYIADNPRRWSARSERS
jgi:REP element-mobilizing transposase RayT